MILAEPPRTQADLNFQLLGFPVRIHPFFWLATILLGQAYWSPPEAALLWVAAVLFCILLHELGHALAMRFYGFRPWIVLHGFGGLTGYGPGDFSARRPGPWGEILISAAGPAAGFLLAAIVVAGFIAAGHRNWVDWYGPAPFLHVVPAIQPDVLHRQWPHLLDFTNMVLQVTVLWGLLNLLPIFPLDGGQIAQQLFLMASPRDGVRQSLMLSVLVAGSLAGLALIRWNDYYLAIFFGYLAYTSYTKLQFYSSRG
jgi:stage IV sporulation protein FB